MFVVQLIPSLQISMLTPVSEVNHCAGVTGELDSTYKPQLSESVTAITLNLVGFHPALPAHPLY